MKASEDKLEALIITQNQTLAALDEQKKATRRAKQKEWYEEQIAANRKLAEETWPNLRW